MALRLDLLISYTGAFGYVSFLSARFTPYNALPGGKYRSNGNFTSCFGAMIFPTKVDTFLEWFV